MKMKTLKRLTAVMCAAMMMSGGSLTVFAAPKTMSDGQTFDAEFYAETYPDVKQAVGTDEAALYNHYATYGKAEGRKPYADAKSQTANTTSASTTSNAMKLPEGVSLHYWTDAEELGNGNYLQHPLYIDLYLADGATYQVTDKDVIAMAKELVPNGTEWGMETFYDTLANVKGKNVPKRNQACGAFAFWLQDAIYGNAPVTRYDYTENGWSTTDGTFEFYMYDIVCYITTTGSFHAGVVIGADSATQTLYLAEGNVNGMVNWNRTIKVDASDGNRVARVYRRG